MTPCLSSLKSQSRIPCNARRCNKGMLVTQCNNINQPQACWSSELLSSASFANRSETCISTIICSCARHSVFAPPAIRRRVESTELELPGINQTQTAPLRDCVALWHKQQPDPGCVHYATNNSQTLAGASGVAGDSAKNCYKLIVACVFSISVAVRFS